MKSRPWRWLVLLAAVLLAWPSREAAWTSVLLPSLSPFMALNTSLAAREVGWFALLAVPVLVVVLFVPRFFCRHVCPTGLLQETVECRRGSKASRWQCWPPVGQWLVLVTLGGAVLGYPFFAWLDPLAIFSSFVNAWRWPLSGAAILAGLGLPLLLLLSVWLPKAWCQRLCPLGAAQELLALTRRRSKPEPRCDEPSPQAGVATNGARRGFLFACAGASGALFLRTAGGEESAPLRPPGSIDQTRFSGVCVRCGNCAQVCPAHIIQPDLGQHGVMALLTPVLSFQKDYCRETCHRCNTVCPSGAIARLTLEQKRRALIGLAELDLEICLLANGRECTACIRGCPYEAIIMAASEDGFSNEPRVESAKCNGCGACEALCPTRPRRAIRVLLRNPAMS